MALVTASTEQQEIEELESLLRLRYETEGLREFITRLVPREPPPVHVFPLIDLVERAQRERVFACFSWPPRHAKSVTILRAIAWWLNVAPADTCAYVSYSDHQARTKSRLARMWSAQANVQIDPRSKDLSEWRTREGGGLLAAGAGGGMTGKGVSGLMIVDDPYKNRTEADSALVRERVWEWFNEVVYTRLEKASVIVIHTRWHDDDLIGRLTKRGDWEVHNLPALAEEEDALGREPGEALWPDRYGIPELEEIRSQIGDWSFAALYQGRPQPRGASVFGEPARFRLPQTPAEWSLFLEGKVLIIGVDPAASEKTHADYSVATVLAFDRLGPGSTCWVLKVVRGQWTIPAFVQQLITLQRTWRARLAVESVAGFKAVPQMLKSINPELAIIEITPSVDKFQRAQPAAAAWNTGRVLVPAGEGAEAWVDPFISELTSFSGVKDAHDDQVDSLSHGFNTVVGARPKMERRSIRSVGGFG